MKTILQSAASLFAVMPGLAALVSGAPVPPEARWLFSVFAQVFGILTILVFWKFQDFFLRLSAIVASVVSVVLVGVGVALSIAYYLLFAYCSIQPTGDFRGQPSVFLPLWLEGDVAKLAANVDNNRTKMVNTLGPGDIDDRLSDQGLTVAKIVTFFVFLITYEGVFICWTLAFCILSVREKKDNTNAGG